MIARWTPDTDHDGCEVDPGSDRARTLAPRMPRYRPCWHARNGLPCPPDPWSDVAVPPHTPLPTTDDPPF